MRPIAQASEVGCGEQCPSLNRSLTWKTAAPLSMRPKEAHVWVRDGTRAEGARNYLHEVSASHEVKMQHNRALWQAWKLRAPGTTGPGELYVA